MQKCKEELEKEKLKHCSFKPKTNNYETKRSYNQESVINSTESRDK